ncbi:hypothetical protein [Pseudomonas sp. Bc-h]|jgi:hypothetical protein|uniref:hypothetical protein n=1 Tax=Pseudomonas sp. Bc-h TaxID=1943632 RepID=UPI001179D45A|nr:hypothetical protein [Pseudomonas sp. Bc-h]
MTLDEVIEATRLNLQGNVYFSPEDLPAGTVIPSEWKNFGVNSESAPKFPATWQIFADELPWVLSLLELGLIGTAVWDGNSLELIYIFHDANGLYYYIGGLPLDACLPEAGSAPPFSGKVSEFYQRVHNGFTFFPAQSMGPQKIENLMCVADLIDEEDTTFASRWMTLLSNGGGDYLAVDLNSLDDKNGVIWWHEEPLQPEVGVGVFEVMDTWMSIFLEDTQPRDNVIS